MLCIQANLRDFLCYNLKYVNFYINRRKSIMNHIYYYFNFIILLLFSLINNTILIFFVILLFFLPLRRYINYFYLKKEWYFMVRLYTFVLIPQIMFPKAFIHDIHIILIMFIILFTTFLYKMLLFDDSQSDIIDLIRLNNTILLYNFIYIIIFLYFLMSCNYTLLNTMLYSIAALNVVLRRKST